MFSFFPTVDQVIFSVVCWEFVFKCLLWIRPFYVEMLNVAVSSLNCRAFIFNHARVSDIIIETVEKSQDGLKSVFDGL